MLETAFDRARNQISGAIKAIEVAIAPLIWTKFCGNVLSHPAHEEEMRAWAEDGHIQPQLAAIAEAALDAGAPWFGPGWRTMETAPFTPQRWPEDSEHQFTTRLDTNGSVLVFAWVWRGADHVPLLWCRLARPPGL